MTRADRAGAFRPTKEGLWLLGGLCTGTFLWVSVGLVYAFFAGWVRL